MSLDEFLYGKLVAYFKKKKQKQIEQDSKRVKLEDIKGRLTFLARAVTGKPIRIFPAEREGGYKGINFFLPEIFPPPAFDKGPLLSYEDNLYFYLFRTLYLCVQKELGYNFPVNSPEVPEHFARQKARKTAPKVLEKLFEDFPGMQEVHSKLLDFLKKNPDKKGNIDTSFLYGKWMTNLPDENPNDKLQNINTKAQKALNEAIKTLKKAKAVEEMVSVQVDKKRQEDYVLQHYFEKVETAEEFDGTWRDFDGDDDLESHANALEELKMKYTVRVDDPVHSVYQAEFIENVSVAESREIAEQGKFFLYDEWDYRRKTYKKDFCKVFIEETKEIHSNYYKETLKKYRSTLLALRKMVANVNNRYKQVRRQTDGEDFDLDALTDLFADIHFKHTPDERVYLSKRKREKELSILMLLDISLSSDSYAANNRIIDVEKQISILFGEILEEYFVDFAIGGFYSKTRNHVTYVNIKDFEESWQKAKHKIGSVQPQGYTRIGAALRHAGGLLAARNTPHKWLLFISDGKPNDYDKYEGKYGINDIKQALRELNVAGINSYALAIEAQAKYYLPMMFGQNRYKILTNPVELLKALIELFEKIKLGN